MKKEARAILRRRAAALAKEPRHERDRSGTTGVVEFMIGPGRYGIELKMIREVCPLGEFTSLPGTPQHIMGVINVRGQIIPVVDLNNYFGIRRRNINGKNEVIILQNETMDFGILAGPILGTREIDPEDIKPVPAGVEVIPPRYVKGIAENDLVILDALSLLNDEGIIVNEEIK